MLSLYCSVPLRGPANRMQMDHLITLIRMKSRFMTTWMKLWKMKMQVLMKIEELAHTKGCAVSEGVDVVPLRGHNVKIFWKDCHS